MMNIIARDWTIRVTAFFAAFACVALAPIPSPASAQRGARAAPPAGREIAGRARAARLDRANIGVGEFQGKKISLIPADLSGLRGVAELEAGQVIGVMQNDVAGDETGLPPGTYNLYLVRLADGWHVYAESGGEIVKEALRVRLERTKLTASRRPQLRPVGWGWTICPYGCTGWTPARVASVTVAPAVLSLLDAQTAQLTATLLDSNGQPLDRAITWSSSNPAVASTTGTGLVTGGAAGTATVTATSEGKSATAVVNVTMRPVGSVAISPATLTLKLGDMAQLTATAKDGSGTVMSRPVTWATSDPRAVTVSPAGHIEAVGVGSATITASAEGKTAAAQITVPRPIEAYSLHFDW